MRSMSILCTACLLGLGLSQPALATNDAAMAKLTECMKMKPATPEQEACLKKVESLRQPAATAKSMTAPPPTVKPKSTAAPTTPPKVIEPPPAVKAAAATVHLNGAPVAAAGSSVGGVGGNITVGDIKGMDLETAMMAIQAQRANLLEGQLKSQMEGIQKRNSEIAALNKLIGDLKSVRPGGTDKEKWGNLGATKAEGQAMYARVTAAGLTMPAGVDNVDEPGTGIYDARQKTFDVWAEQLKGKIDSLNSSQQMDMLRMQSLTNKRNEAFDLMTNFIKKMQDNRSSIIGNMR